MAASRVSSQGSAPACSCSARRTASSTGRAFGSGLGALGAHVQHRVVRHQALARGPGVEAAPAREDERDAAPAAPARMHLRDEAADVAAAQLQQRQAGRLGQPRQAFQVQGVERERAGGQPLFDAHVFQIAQRGFGQGDGRGLGGIGRALGGCRPCPPRRPQRRRERAALASSAMRARKSVPMSAWKRCASGEPSTSRPKAGPVPSTAPSRSGSRASDCTW